MTPGAEKRGEVEAGEERRVDARFQMVTCCECGCRFQCTPGSDYYNNTTLEDGVCERCLLTGKKGAAPPDPDPLKSPLIQEMVAKGAAHVDEQGRVTIGPPLPAFSTQPKKDSS